ncbi:MAG: rhodanese-like domain-containing protein [Planctomycetota bacterium]|nr:MAG: rhodanese-like domain-containing protein [Planctomycetota bacterium]REJ87096.1 MAG: rhodanese-like domain-containing protein [Planctomycetota bacterium]REK26986.1 MAG: rhodanese-like domain-containing protein [Planctomycetota bacterium]REK47287.1 MAG: rhodanese-like domain-containing protein [Planctomycetota bacterium]
MRPLPRVLIACSLILIPASLIPTMSMEAVQPTDDSLDLVRAQIAGGKAVLVDVREVEETDEGYLAGAILLPLSEIAENHQREDYAETLAEAVATDKVVYTYCKAGVRAQMAGEVFARFRYDVRPLPLGFADLVAEGFNPAGQ